mgnify:CR=1 FL=1
MDGEDAPGLFLASPNLVIFTEGLSQNWENPVFPSGPSLIPSLPAVPLSTDPSLPKPGTTTSDLLTRSRTSLLSSFFRTTSTTALHHLPTDLGGAAQTFSKASLQHAEFVAQVDRKFILVRLRATPSEGDEDIETLVMVDQHAADERVRVERFLRDVCGRVARGEEVESWAFAEPVPVVVSRAEAEELEGREGEFTRWGIGIKCDGEGAEGDYVQVYVRTVPLVVADRLRTEPKLLQELVRSYLAQLVEGPRRTGVERTKVGGAGERSWGSVVRECPPVLLDLINSKACRGAIMFNDGEFALVVETKTSS